MFSQCCAKLTDTGLLEMCERCPALRHLTLKLNDVSWAAIEKVRAARPSMQLTAHGDYFVRDINADGSRRLYRGPQGMVVRDAAGVNLAASLTWDAFVSVVGVREMDVLAPPSTTLPGWPVSLHLLRGGFDLAD